MLASGIVTVCDGRLILGRIFIVGLEVGVELPEKIENDLHSAVSLQFTNFSYSL